MVSAGAWKRAPLLLNHGLMRNIAVGVVAIMGLFVSCGGDDDDDAPPPPPANVIANQPVVPPQPQGQVMITVAASSNPSGATVTGGGRVLGVTPLQTQVPIPAPRPGDPPMTFAFTFELANYQTATINASPVNNTISITAALAPVVAAQEVPVGNDGNEEAGEAGEIVVRGSVANGAIFDNHD